MSNKISIIKSIKKGGVMNILIKLLSEFKYLFFIYLLAGAGFIFSYDYPKPIPGYYSQKGQDKYLNEHIFKNKHDGVFVEVGAHDGISFSNTYFFEKELGWTGICIDPNPTLFEKLKKNRNCICEQLCISDSFGQKPFLLCIGYILEMYSGLLNNYHQSHLDRINHEMNIFGGSKEVIFVQCSPLQDVLDKYHISHIDLLSIDIEGGEEAAIRSIDLDKINVGVILIENNFNEPTIKNYLIPKGYTLISHIGKDDLYIKGTV